MTGTLRNKPAKCCCDCDCILSSNFDDWIETAGDWTITTGASFEATTGDSDAELTSDVSHSGWQTARLVIRQRKVGEWVRFGFRDASGDDRVYIRWKVTKPAANYVHDIEIVEVDDGGPPTTLATINRVGGISSGEMARTYQIWYDPDHLIFELMYAGATWTGPVRETISAVVDRPFVATETVSDTVDFEVSTNAYALYRKCLYRSGTPVSKHTDRAPTEFEVTLSGVTAGSDMNGADFGVWNDTFVLRYVEASHTYYFSAATPYSGISLTLTVYYDYPTKKIVAELRCAMVAVSVKGGIGWGQESYFTFSQDGLCSFDWRTLGDDEYYGNQAGQVLDYDHSVCSALGSSVDPCDWGADFTQAIATMIPIP